MEERVGQFRTPPISRSAAENDNSDDDDGAGIDLDKVKNKQDHKDDEQKMLTETDTIFCVLSQNGKQ
jgi:hypothetical protein